MLVKEPVKAFKKNCLLNGEDCIWAYYHVFPRTISKNTPKKTQEIKEMMARLLLLLADYEDVELVMYPRTMNLRTKFDTLGKGFSPDSQAIGAYYAKETVTLLEREGQVYRPSFILGIKVKEKATVESFHDVINLIWLDLAGSLARLFGLEVDDLETLFSESDPYVKEVTQLLYSFSIRPLVKKELLYLNRLQYIRGMAHKVEEQNNWEVLKDNQGTYVRIPKEHKGLLQLEDELGSSYLALLPIGETPENMRNCDLFQFAQDLSFPAELRMKIHYPRLKGQGGIGLKLNWLSERFKTEHKELVQNDEEPSERLLTVRGLVKHLKQRVDNGQPVVDWIACFIVYGQTVEEVRQNSATVIQQLHTIIHIHRAKNDQRELFYKCLLGQPLGRQLHWKHRTTVEAVGEWLFSAVSELGMESGWYIGRQDTLGDGGSRGEKTPLEELIYASNRFVFLNLLAIAEGIKGALFDAPHVAVTGKTGKGKTFLVGLLFLYSSFMNVQSLFVDPKGEKRKWFTKLIQDPYYQKHYPLFVEHLQKMSYVTLDATNPRNYGVLDPIVCLSRVDAKQVAQDMIDELSPLGTNHLSKGAVLKGIQEVLVQKEAGQQVGLMHVVDYLEQMEQKEVREYGEFLRLTVEDSILRLGFSYGENPGLDFNAKTTILEIQDLKLPNDNVRPELYTDADRKSLCLMISLGRFCEMFGKRDSSKKTAIYFTEAWVFNNSNAGRSIIAAMARVGRSQMNQLVLDTQFIGDLGSDKEKGNFGVVFAFDEDSEREKILNHLRLEVNEANLAEMSHMIKGQCWMLDPYGRVGKLNVHSLFEEMTAALQTTEKTSHSQVEEQDTLIMQ